MRTGRKSRKPPPSFGRRARGRADVLGEGWPKAANALSGKPSSRASPALRKAGILIEWPTRHGDLKTIKIRYVCRTRE